MAHSRRRAVLAAAVAALGLLAASCGKGSGVVASDSLNGTPQQGGVATWAELSGASPNWIFPFVDSAHNSVNSVLQFENLMYRPLYWFGDGSQPTLNSGLSLAEDPQYQDNNSKVVVNLKPYTWSNGEQVTAKNIMFWMNMMFAEKGNYAGYVTGEFPDNVKSVTATGPNQVTFTLDNSYSTDWFTNDELALITPMPMAWDKTSDSAAPGSGGCAESQDNCAAVYNYLYKKSENLSTYATDPVWQIVDGPWKLKSFTTDGNVDMVPNPTYSGPIKPKLAEFKELPFTRDEAEYNVMRNGKTINVGEVPHADLPQRSLDSSTELPPSSPLGDKYAYASEHDWAWSYMPINYANPTIGPAFQQLYIRQALQLTIDQKTDNKVAWRGYAVSTTGAIPTSPKTKYIPSSQQGDGPYPFDVNRAKNLLTSHGWTDKNGVMTCVNPGSGANQCGTGIPAGQALHFTLEYANGVQPVVQLVQQWQSDASKAGISIALNAQPFNTVISDVTSCPQKKSTCGWQAALFGLETYSGATPTGDPFFLPGAAVNYSSVNDPALTQLVNATLHDSSIDTFHKYADYVAQQLPGALNYSDSYRIYASSMNMGGVAPLNPFGSLTPENWYFTK